MTCIRKHALATAVALAAAVAAGQALAVGVSAWSPQSVPSWTMPAYGANTPSDSAVKGPAVAPSRQAMGSTDDAVESIDLATAPPEPGLAEGRVVRSVPAYAAAPGSPRYTPETGDVEYGSKLRPVGPQSNRFNDATGP